MTSVGLLSGDVCAHCDVTISSPDSEGSKKIPCAPVLFRILALAYIKTLSSNLEQ